MSTTFACDMTAIPVADRPAHRQLIHRLITQAAENIREVPDGFAFRFPASEYQGVTEFVARERLCCPFLAFTLEVLPEQGPLILQLTGAAGVKEFIRAELSL